MEWHAGGGILPQSWKLTLDSSGKVVTSHLEYPTGPIVVAGARPVLRTREGNVRAAEVTRLRGLMDNANLPELSKRKLDWNCADCYTTSIGVKSGDKAYVVYQFLEENGASEKLFDAIYDLYKSFDPAP
jgi:hypothetical protein